MKDEYIIKSFNMKFSEGVCYHSLFRCMCEPVRCSFAIGCNQVYTPKKGDPFFYMENSGLLQMGYYE